jgi:hypothetical protein
MLTNEDSRSIDFQMGCKPMFSATLEHMCHLHYVVMEEIADTLEEWNQYFSISVAKKILVQLGYTNSQIADGARLRRERNKESKLDVATATFEQLMSQRLNDDDWAFDSTNVEFEEEE